MHPYPDLESPVAALTNLEDAQYYKYCLLVVPEAAISEDRHLLPLQTDADKDGNAPRVLKLAIQFPINSHSGKIHLDGNQSQRVLI